MGRSWPLPALMVPILFLVGAAFAPGSQDVQARGATIECSTLTAATPAAGAAAPVIPKATADFPAEGGNLTVFAAASLTDAFEQIKSDLEAAHPGLMIAYNFGGSQALVTQLAEGAGSDVFASANNAQMQAAIGNGSIAGTPVTFAWNRLTLVIPADNPAHIASPADLATPGVKLVLAQPEVPAGRYAREAVCKMGQESETFGKGFVAAVGANIVSEEKDVRDVLAKVQLGEADAGIVYVSDANVAGGAVQVIPIPDAVNVVASYPIAVVAEGNEALADGFIAYMLGEDGQATLAEFGFEPIG